MRKGITLTEEDVLDIHRLANGGVLSQRQIAQAYGIAQSHVCRIKYTQTWEWLFEQEAAELKSV